MSATQGRSGTYRWWYVDAVSDDRERALVAIFFVGSVFSPHYARRQREVGALALPEEHVAVNLALYERGKAHTWVFSEYGAGALSEGPREMAIARSAFRKSEDGSATISIDDRTVARRRRVRGTIRVRPLEGPLTEEFISLADGHEWRAHVPRAKIEASFDGFDLVGTGYHDENRGTEPPARAFASWSWGRFHDEGATRVFFDLEKKRRSGASQGAIDLLTERSVLSVETGAPPRVESFPARFVRGRLSSWLAPLPDYYQAGRRSDGSLREVSVRQMLEPAPFYARFLASSAAERYGRETIGMAEHISFDRTHHPLVERMIGLRLARPEKGSYGWIP